MKSDKLLKIIAVVTVLLLVLAVIGKKQGWFGKALTIKVATEEAEFRSIIETITANGKIQPEKEVKISPDVSGEIIQLNVREGDFVEQGDLLFKIKPDTYISVRARAEAALESARARMTQSEAQFLQAELAFKRNKQLFNEKAISESEFEQSEASFKVASAEVEAARFSIRSSEASLKEANEQLTKTTVYAPMRGTISTLLVEQGERVVGTEMMSGTEVLRIADLTRMEVRASVNENDIIKVKAGDTAVIEVDAWLDQSFKGVVTEIANSATSSGVSADQVTTFDVKILILPSSYEHLKSRGLANPFRPGMSATADIMTDKRDNIITVPIQAVTTRADTSDLVTTLSKEEIRTLVFITDGTYALARDVKTGIQDNNYIEILSGISKGDNIISAPYTAISKKLSDSTLVEIVKKEDLFEKAK